MQSTAPVSDNQPPGDATGLPAFLRRQAGASAAGRHCGQSHPDEPTMPSPEEFVFGLRATTPARRMLTWYTVAGWRLQIGLSRLCRRLLDITGALTGLVVLSPLLAITAIAIRIESPGPILFRQRRVGLRGAPFTMYKFRSMRDDAETEKQALQQLNESADGVTFKIKADPRVTRVGRVIRRLSIDEIPQLVNILLGQMSIVGPRPAVPEEVEQYGPEERKRLETNPGLTCFWQIGGRSELPFRQQVDLDLRYLQEQSLFKDISIIARTVPAVLSGRGAF